MKNMTEKFPDISFIDNTVIDELVAQMISDYKEKYKEITGKQAILAPADPFRLIMYACATQIYQGMQYADYAGKMSFLKYSHDEYLDNLAALRGVIRREATAATTVLQFSMESPIASVVAIPAGTRVTNGNNVYFSTDEYAEIPAGQTTITVPATCMTPGLDGMDIAAGELNVLVNTLPYISDVSNIAKTSGGAERETDNSLKDRVFNVADTYSTAGPSGAYEYFVKSVDASITDVQVRMLTPGVVDICFLCEGGNLPDDTLVQKVEETILCDRKKRPLTDNIVVHAPQTREYNIELEYYIGVSSKSAVATIQANIENAVSMYNMWQTEKIGRDINPDCLTQKIWEAGAKRVRLISPEFAVIEEDTVAKTGTVKVIYGGLEDD